MPDILRDLVTLRQRHSVTDLRYKAQVTEKIGDRIKLWRKRRKLTVQELASAAGLAASTLYDLERGISTTTTKLYEIAKKLQVSVEYLSYGKADPLTGEIPQQDIPARISWPFAVKKDRYDQLTDREKEILDNLITAYVSHAELTRNSQVMKRRSK